MIALLLFAARLAAAPELHIVSATTVSTDRWVAQSAVFSVDGKRLAYLQGNHLYVMDIDSHVTRDLGLTARSGESLAFAPDGKSMYFTSDRVLYLRPIDGPGQARKIAEHIGRGVVFSPDGQTLSYVRYNERLEQFLLADLEGGHERILFQSRGSVSGWAWSADSSTIAVILFMFRGQNAALEIKTIPVKPGGELHDIAVSKGYWPGLVWSYEAGGLLVNNEAAVWHYSLSEKRWSEVESTLERADYSGIRRAGPDGWTVAAHRQRVVRDFWQGLMGVFGMGLNQVLEDLVLLRMAPK